MMNKHNRFIGIDIFRGMAIVLMVIFHIFYDLKYFGYVEIDFVHDVFWEWFRYIIVAMFLLTVGMSLKLANDDKINWKGMRKRLFLLGGASLLVSVSTYIQFPQTWVYFGILHFVLVASFLALPFLYIPRIALAISIVIMIGYLLKVLHFKWLFSFLVTPLHLPLDYTEDLVHFFPWFSFVLFGMVFIHYGWHYSVFDTAFFNAKTKAHRLLTFMGRHALMIYLAHLPMLFGIFMLIDLL